ncbi:GNAT family N-acetyltransferase [Pseudonocardia charpentierae]|uniref:GNAT family N-acetyltransferase n=1 Tax=Pseudonocardia charpentierae TaxID=3075545 RepID=A0ABU2NG16_9PSEU|nr:GNAT family N-acetyltransferase [Pseudonocardia sp. DSM 45834]MDT0352901.1 GNAT family N-acetyltransferase [Pseudonocardia sp. DSM 45834]
MVRRPTDMDRTGWALARWRTRAHDVRFLYRPPPSPVWNRRLTVCDTDWLDVAELVWQVCDDCRRGRINKISIAVEYQRQGLGRRLVRRAWRDGPDQTWTTTSQSPEAQRFFPVITAETGAAFTPHGGGCPHFTADSQLSASVPRPPARLDLAP